MARSRKATTKTRKGGNGLFSSLKESWSDIKDKKGGGGGIDVPEGDYTVVLQEMTLKEVEYTDKVETSDGVKQVKGKCPQLTIVTVVDRGKHEGKQLRDVLDIRARGGLSEDSAMDMFRQRLQGCGVDTSAVDDPDELVEICAEHAEAEPLIRITAKKNKGGYINLRYKGLVEDDEEEKDDEAPFDTDDDEEEADMEEDDADDEEDDVDEDDDEGEDDEPQKDDAVKFKPPKSRRAIECVVVTVNKSKKTCTLKDDKGKTYKDVSWDKMEILFDED